MEIDRNYNYLKFRRTYIGNSKKNELKVFSEVQNNLNWIEYRKILFQYFEDLLHVYFSCSYLSNIISFTLLGISIFSLTLGILIVTHITTMLAIMFQLLNYHFKYLIKKTFLSYNISNVIIKNQLNKTYGLNI